MLESELKAKSDHIRTIIKARGISYPNITGKTFAVFRVDNKHHLMSMASMLDPSPDWIVGVSSLELCLRNCTWIESKILNLYPWDVGTDDGITYLSPNQPSAPRQAIKRLRPNHPNDPRSPFYDPINSDMKPLARLYLSRQRLYEKTCDPSIIEEFEDSNTNCETEAWSEWSPCSATCGRGIKYKQRRYRSEDSKYVCHKKLTERAVCEAVRKYCPHQPSREVEDPMCELGAWSEWSSCSVTCGKGTKTRDRKYKNRFAAKSCVAGKERPPLLQQNLECFGDGKCDDFEEELNENCPEKPWSDWSPCSATCGKGIKERYRLSLEYTHNQPVYWPYYKSYGSKHDRDQEDFDEDDPCNTQKLKETVECMQKVCPQETKVLNAIACTLPKDVGACKSSVDRWYFDGVKGQCEIFSYSGCEGNLNNFNTLEHCQTLCSEYQKELIANLTARKKDVKVSGVLSYKMQNDGTPGNNLTANFAFASDQKIVDCKVSDWSDWSPCNVSYETCGFGHKYKFRKIEMHPKNGGKLCPKKLSKKRKCRITCPNKNNYLKLHQSSPLYYTRFNMDCILSPWSAWSSCGTKCEFEYQERQRHVVVEATGTGKSCSEKIERKPCICT